MTEQYVKQGQLLFEIEPDTYRAALRQANGVMEQAQAKFTQARQNLNRVLPLYKKNAVSQKDRDDAQAAYDSAKADLDSAKAAVSEAEIKLSHAYVTAPVAGSAVFTMAASRSAAVGGPALKHRKQVKRGIAAHPDDLLTRTATAHPFREPAGRFAQQRQGPYFLDERTFGRHDFADQPLYPGRKSSSEATPRASAIRRSEPKRFIATGNAVPVFSKSSARPPCFTTRSLSPPSPPQDSRMPLSVPTRPPVRAGRYIPANCRT